MSSPDPSTWCPTPPPVPPAQDRRKLIGCDWDSMKHTGWSPIRITGLLRDQLTRHFSAAYFIENPSLKALLWQPGDATGIMIESVDRYRAALADKRPAILVKRNAMQNLRVVRQDLYGPDRQGNQNYVTLWVGSHSLFCIHGTGNSCEILATEAQRELTQFGPVMTDKLGLFKFQVTEAGPISAVEEASQNFVVPITVGWAYQETWKLSPEQLALTGIGLTNNVFGD